MRAPPPTGTPSDPAHPVECDLVMKGGITSGVVYPGAVVELSRRYRFRSVGGSSAGAIAAGAAAAAEHGRQAGAAGAGSGFAGLADLPRDLGAMLPGGVGRLASLFQPSARTAFVHAVLMEVLAGAGTSGKLGRGLSAALLSPPALWPLLLGLAGAVWLSLEAVRAGSAGLAVALALAAAAWIALGASAGLLLFAWRSLAAVRTNGFGICDGLSVPEPARRLGVEPLTPWLDRTFRRLAGTTGPLTLADLEKHGVDLAVTTTSLTNMRPYRLPFHRDDPLLFFSEREFRALFPGDVVAALLAAAAAEAGAARGNREHRRSRARIRAARAEYRRASRRRGEPDRLVAFPRGGGLPVVVAVRMSLSFPLLLSAVPLWGVDWRPRPGRSARARELERVWFSDGGICSNMPIHFFDAALPTRPTFAIDLRDAAAGEEPRAWLPETNGAGIAQRWTRLADGAGGVLDFAAAIVTTMQTWVDETLLLTPGFRDRTAHVSVAPHEGGLNLDMSAATIGELSRRGASAGVLLRDRFGWRNHLWVRFRTLANVLERFVGPAWQRYAPGTARRAELGALVAAHTGTGSYPVTRAQAACADAALSGLDALAVSVQAAGPGLAAGAPRPTPELRVRPRF